MESDSQAIGLSTPLTDLPRIGPARAARFTRLDVHVVSDLLRHLPLRYEHEWGESSIENLPLGQIGSTRGTIVASRLVPRTRPGGSPRFEATLQDHRERLYLVWFNARHLRDQLHPGAVVRVQGTVKHFGGYLQMVNPKWEMLDDTERSPTKNDRLRPVYPATEDLPSQLIEEVVADTLPQILDRIVDPLEEDFIRHRAMPELAVAYRQVHQPKHEDEATAGRRRLAYNELLLLQLGIAIKRHYNQYHLRCPALTCSEAIDRHIRDRFPFALTESQNKVINEIVADLQRSTPMNRLLQGDVGSGKTVVALYALLMAVAAGKQGALMAPTELLAEQHFMSITGMLKDSSVRVALLTAQSTSSGSSDRRTLLERIQSGQVDIVIGTQALLSESVQFRELVLVVVDEQHRFGVMQRAAFRAGRDGKNDCSSDRRLSPHYLVMTATPIPRTLSLTIFGDLDISTIRELPPGRLPIITRLVGEKKSEEVYAYLDQRISLGEQAYVVVPTIEDASESSGLQLKNVQDHARNLQKKLPKCSVATIHGQLKREKRQAIMDEFRRGQIQVLVATTVIEVGVDVPNATMMVVEDADRFGLAQLHQLRGRIGRASDGKRSVCVFIADQTTTESQQRMEAISSTNDGFVIAEKDLEIRGMGDFFGTRQHGLPPLRVASIPRDIALLKMAGRDAQAIIQADPNLTRSSHAFLKRILMRDYGDAVTLIDVG